MKITKAKQKLENIQMWTETSVGVWEWMIKSNIAMNLYLYLLRTMCVAL